MPPSPPPPPAPLLPRPEIDRLRAALADYTVTGVDEALGPVGRAAHARGDLPGVARELRTGPADDRLRTVIGLFLLGAEVTESAAAAAFAPATSGAPAIAAALDALVGAGILARSAGAVRAAVEIRPYAEAGDPLTGTSTPATPWWVVSDLGSDVRPGPLPRDHVLGIGSASVTLAQLTPRDPVRRALDVGTGSGVQALHLSGHSAHVTATDVSPRALRLAATTAALSRQVWDLRQGSLLDPVAGDRFDLVVANPPFVVSAGRDGSGDGYDYSDSGLPGDAVCEVLVGGLPAILSPGGTAVLLANWIIPREGEWAERVTGWIRGRGCDAWIWQREVADLGEYVSLWLRDSGLSPAAADWSARYDAWLDWFDRTAVAAVGMGVVALRRSDGTGGEVVVAEDVAQAIELPAGAHVASWFGRQRFLAGTGDAALLASRLRTAPGLIRHRRAVTDGTGWQNAYDTVAQTRGLRWELEVDDAIADVLAGCDGSLPIGAVLALAAAARDLPAAAVVEAALPVVRDLVGRGFLLPPESPA